MAIIGDTYRSNILPWRIHSLASNDRAPFKNCGNSSLSGKVWIRSLAVWILISCIASSSDDMLCDKRDRLITYLKGAGTSILLSKSFFIDLKKLKGFLDNTAKHWPYRGAVSYLPNIFIAGKQICSTWRRISNWQNLSWVFAKSPVTLFRCMITSNAEGR